MAVASYGLASGQSPAQLGYADMGLSNTVTLNEAKVVFLGEGHAGKTHAVERLVAGGADEGVDPEQTDGISITPLCLDPETRSFSEDPADGAVTVRMRDFGGQYIMHSMHRCFLTRRCLYVVVLRERASTPYNDLADQAIYWLSTIFSFADDADVLIAVNCESGTGVFVGEHIDTFLLSYHSEYRPSDNNRSAYVRRYDEHIFLIDLSKADPSCWTRVLQS